MTDDESGDECDIDCNEYVMDSFIDDATQMTQRTPVRNKKGAKLKPSYLQQFACASNENRLDCVEGQQSV